MFEFNHAHFSQANIHRKSQLVSLLLTSLFGPLGLLYCNVGAAFMLSVVAVMTVSTKLIPLFCWCIAIITGMFAVDEHNEKSEEVMCGYNK